jgi:hypothetical protein
LGSSFSEGCQVFFITEVDLRASSLNFSTKMGWLEGLLCTLVPFLKDLLVRRGDTETEIEPWWLFAPAAAALHQRASPKSLHLEIFTPPLILPNCTKQGGMPVWAIVMLKNVNQQQRNNDLLVESYQPDCLISYRTFAVGLMQTPQRADAMSIFSLPVHFLHHHDV